MKIGDKVRVKSESHAGLTGVIVPANEELRWWPDEVMIQDWRGSHWFFRTGELELVGGSNPELWV